MRERGSSRKANNKTNVKAVEVTNYDDKSSNCRFCFRGKTDDVFESGKLYKMGEFFLHFFCILFSKYGVQKGEDEEGLHGFLLPDIRKELARGRKLRCAFCERANATLECHYKGCGLKFHFPCNLVANGANIFKEEAMISLCAKHLPEQRKKLLKNRPPVQDRTCLAGCQEKVDSKQKIHREKRYLISPCCGRYYHLICLQRMALSSGSAHYKCPTCSDKDKFTDVSIEMGIYIPVQDASWENPELEEFYNYAEMARLERRCVAKVCYCEHERKRSYHQPGSKFEIIRCDYCGSSGIHIKCGKLKKKRPAYTCDKCVVINKADENTNISNSDISDDDDDDESPILSPTSSSASPLQLLSESSSSDDDEKLERIDREKELIRQRLRRKSESTEFIDCGGGNSKFENKPVLRVINPLTGLGNLPVQVRKIQVLLLEETPSIGPLKKLPNRIVDLENIQPTTTTTTTKVDLSQLQPETDGMEVICLSSDSEIEIV